MFGIGRSLARKYSTVGLGPVPHICIIGSGPAGFYTAQQILRSHPAAQVDILEKLPVPFGLVRYGVAPDHPEVKNCINIFTQAALSDRVSFNGNISVGQDISLSQLKEAYHAIVLAYGAAKDRTLDIPGEDLPNVLPAKRLVGWYNGLPEDINLNVNFDVENVAIIGQGNVAIDVARILLTSVDVLKKTDIPQSVLEKLSKSRIRNVTLVGRRRSQNIACTIKELREMINLKGCRPLFRKEDFEQLPSLIPEAPRSRKRLLELMTKVSLENLSADKFKDCRREWGLRFLLSPLEILASDHMGGIKGILFGKNRIENNQAVMTEETEFIDCGMIVRSIGYTSLQIDKSIPFDHQKGIVPNINGKVVGQDGLYVSGWIGTGAVGVILSTMDSAFKTGKLIMSHIESGLINVKTEKKGRVKVLKILEEKGVHPVTFDEWSRLDKHEVQEGKRLGKPREKVTDVAKMLEIESEEV